MTVRIDIESKTLWVGVGDLIRTFKGGIGRSAVPEFRGRWGQHAHKLRTTEAAATAGRRLTEVSVSHSIRVNDYTAVISGRVDSILVQEDSTVVEEIKTVTWSGQRLENCNQDTFPMFRDQLRAYLYLLEFGSEYQNLSGRLALVSLLDGTTVLVPVSYQAGPVFLLLRSRILGLLRTHERRALKKKHQASRSGSLRFPYDRPRKYQAEVDAAVFEALDARNHLLVSAPTGTGKTAAVLHAALRFALSEGKRIFWATAKTSQQDIVTETLELTLPHDAAFSGVVIAAKEKLCPNRVFCCDEDYCMYARDFYERLHETGLTESLLGSHVVPPAQILDAARKENLCPFELTLELVNEADLVVGDYNYVFDPASSLRRLFFGKYRDWILIIDEAHNLYPRARQCFSPTLSLRSAKEAEKFALNANWCPPDAVSIIGEARNYLASLTRKLKKQAGQRHAVTEIDKGFFSRLSERLDVALSGFFLERVRAGVETEEPAGTFLTDLRRFCHGLESDDEFAHVYDGRDGGILKLFCLDPSSQLAERLAGFHSAIAVSATLKPQSFFANVLGFPPDQTLMREFGSPFPTENRKVLIIPNITTTFRARQHTAPQVARLIVELASLRRGPYAVFFPSFAYLDLVRPHFRDFPGQVLVQERSMQAHQVRNLLARLNEETTLLMAVQGGLFGEGVDYPGASLIGAFIVGVGLPEPTLENELLKEHFAHKYEAGFEYAYLYPGMMRVVQSAGRVIRSENDAGLIVLIGKQFTLPEYAALIPREWYDYSIEELVVADPCAAAREFWESIP